MADDGRITRDDLEAKFREIKTGVDQQAFVARNKAVPVAAGVGFLLLLLVFLLAMNGLAIYLRNRFETRW